jgi:hypothetical protein
VECGIKQPYLSKSDIDGQSWVLFHGSWFEQALGSNSGRMKGRRGDLLKKMHLTGILGVCIPGAINSINYKEEKLWKESKCFSKRTKA